MLNATINSVWCPGICNDIFSTRFPVRQYGSNVICKKSSDGAYTYIPEPESLKPNPITRKPQVKKRKYQEREVQLRSLNPIHVNPRIEDYHIIHSVMKALVCCQFMIVRC